MNDFANSLLTLLLSWMRSFFSGLLTVFQSDGMRFWVWLEDRWLILFCVLIFLGIACDIFFYILRWHPQRVWSTRLRSLFGRRNALSIDPNFSQGYEDGLTGFNFGDAPIQDLSWNESDVSNMLIQYYNEPVTAYDHATPLSQMPVEDQPSAPRRRRSDRHSRRHLHACFSDAQPQVRGTFHDAVYPSDETPQSWNDQLIENGQNNNE